MKIISVILENMSTRSIDCSTYIKSSDRHVDAKTTEKPLKVFLPRLASKSTEPIVISKSGSCALNLVGHDGTKINGVPIMIIGLNVPSSTVKLNYDGQNWTVA